MATIVFLDENPASEAARQTVLALEKAGFSVMQLTTSEEVVSHCKSMSVDACVIGIRIPGMNGLEVMARVLDIDRRILVVLYTSFDGYRYDFTSWAADAFVTRGPQSDEELIRSLCRPLGERG